VFRARSAAAPNVYAKMLGGASRGTTCSVAREYRVDRRPYGTGRRMDLKTRGR